MAHVFQVVVRKGGERTVQVVAETPEEAQTKVALEEGEELAAVNDAGEVVL